MPRLANSARPCRACRDRGGRGRASARAFTAAWCRTVNHAPFGGLNRAKAAVVEAAILISRLDMLPRDKIESEIAYLQIAVSKTASAAEQEAWTWLMERIRQYYASSGQPAA